MEVMYATNSSNMTVGTSSFDNNKAGHSGGVMYAEFYSSITVGNSSLDNNKVDNDGGVMYAYHNKIKVGNIAPLTRIKQEMMVELCMPPLVAASLWTTAPWTTMKQAVEEL